MSWRLPRSGGTSHTLAEPEVWVGVSPDRADHVVIHLHDGTIRCGVTITAKEATRLAATLIEIAEQARRDKAR